MPRISRWTWTMGLVLALWSLPTGVVGQSAAKDSASKGKAQPDGASPDDGGWKQEEKPKSPPEQSAGGTQTRPASDPPAGEAQPARATRKAPATPTAEPGLDGATYQIRLRDLEQQVDELKEQIRRSHTRLSLLSDTLLAGGGGGARAEIVFENELSGAFKLTEAVFVLDGAVQYRKQDETGGLASQKTIPIFSGSIPAGDHTLQVLLKVSGHGYGVFSYLRGYHFDLRGDHSFTVTDGKVVEVKVVAWERGGATTPLEDRPTLRYGVHLRNIGDAPSPAPAANPEPDGASQVGGRVEKGVSVGGGD